MQEVKRVYFDYLDALRCLAFLGVFYAHSGTIFLGATLSDTFPLGLWKRFTVYGSYGVNFFFVLSGFLITYLLLKEKEKTGTVAIKHFYRKRVLRIWPVYFATLFLGVCVIPLLINSGTSTLFTMTDPNISLGAFFYHLFFAGNFYTGAGLGLWPSLSIGILWSVCVEEQFYLVWPWIVRWFSLRKLAYITAFLISLSLLYKFLWADDRNANYYLPWSVGMDIGFGALLGMSYFVKKTRRIIYSSIGIIAGSFAFVALITWVSNKTTTLDAVRLVKSLVVDCIFMLIILFFINRTAAVEHSGKRKIRRKIHAILTHLGKISYGLYAYHAMCLMLTVHILRVVGVLDAQIGNAAFFLTCLLAFALSVLVSEISFRFMEKRFLALKDKKQ